MSMTNCNGNCATCSDHTICHDTSREDLQEVFDNLELRDFLKSLSSDEKEKLGIK